MNFLKDVERFYQAMGDGHLVNNVPVLLSEERAVNRNGLLLEEVNEYGQATTLEGKADALVDILYILSGAIIEHGLQDRFQALWNEVQRANMTKVCRDQAHIDQTVMMYDKKNIRTLVEFNGTMAVVKRLSDNKVMKPLDWTPPNLKAILEAEGFQGLTVDDLNEAEADRPGEVTKGIEAPWVRVNDFINEMGVRTILWAMEMEGVGILVMTEGIQIPTNEWYLSDVVYVPGAELWENTDGHNGTKTYKIIASK